MFEALGRITTRGWPFILLFWAAAWIAVVAARPPWSEVTADGEFAFLPPNCPSRIAERQFRRSFGNDLLRSSIVLVLSRPSRPAGLTGPEDAPVEQPEAHDEGFLADTLLPALRETLIDGGFAPRDLPVGDLPIDAAPDAATPPLVEAGGEADASPYPVAAVLTSKDRVVGPLFTSRDQQAVLVMLGLRTEYGESANAPLVHAVERLVDRLHQTGALPAGLELAVSGTAVVGRDMREASERSGRATHLASVILVVGLLLAIYRAPALAAVPLLTVVVGAEIAIGLLGIAAQRGWMSPFLGLEVYVTVVAYGAGVDYCMFLMARYREELDAAPDGSLAGSSGPRSAWGNSLARAMARVGPALAASAGTTVAGVAMMGLAEFAKFQQAAAGIAMGLIVVTAAALTLTPALLCGMGRVAFWPKIPHGRPAAHGGWLPVGSITGVSRARRLRRFWSGLANRVCGSPGRWMFAVLAIMVPLAVVGASEQNRVTYGLLSELPDDAPGVIGAEAVRRHFPPGETGPATVLVTAPARTGDATLDFRDRSGDGRQRIRTLTESLWERREELGIASIRSLSAPLGAAEDAPAVEVDRSNGPLAAIARRAAIAVAVRNYYIATDDASDGRTTRLDVIFQDDPFTRGSLARLEGLRQAVEESLPTEMQGSTVSVLGATASLSDLAFITARDRWRVSVLVLLGVGSVLVLLLRRWALSAFLMGTVALGYLTTLGAVVLLFRLLAWWAGEPEGFAGLDWKVPTLLFTILVAVGEDYNIYLVTRVDEERAAARGPGVSEAEAAVTGVRTALARTGAIISGCGLIMAGTFGSLAVGELAGMVQLGVALAAGVLLDTFVIRPVLVPAYLTLLHGGRFGRVGRWMGAAQDRPPADHAADDERDASPERLEPGRTEPGRLEPEHVHAENA